MGTDNDVRLIHEDDPTRDFGTPCLARFAALCGDCHRRLTWCHMHPITQRQIVAKRWRCADCLTERPHLSIVGARGEAAS